MDNQSRMDQPLEEAKPIVKILFVEMLMLGSRTSTKRAAGVPQGTRKMGFRATSRKTDAGNSLSRA
jgi:hypothetical protein